MTYCCLVWLIANILFSYINSLCKWTLWYFKEGACLASTVLTFVSWCIITYVVENDWHLLLLVLTAALSTNFKRDQINICKSECTYIFCVKFTKNCLNQHFSSALQRVFVPFSSLCWFYGTQLQCFGSVLPLSSVLIPAAAGSCF